MLKTLVCVLLLISSRQAIAFQSDWPEAGPFASKHVCAAVINSMDSALEIGVTLDGNPSYWVCLLYTSPSPRDATLSRMPSSA